MIFFLLDFVFLFGFSICYHALVACFVPDYPLMGWLWASFIPTVALAGVAFALGPRKKIFCLFFGLLSGVFALLGTANVFLFQSPIDTTSIYAMLFSTGPETVGFMTAFFSWQLVALCVGQILLYVFVYRRIYATKQEFYPPAKFTLALLGTCCCLMFFFFAPDKTLYTSFADGPHFTHVEKNFRNLYYFKIISYIPYALNLNTLDVFTAQDITCEYQGPLTVFLVISESTNKRHLSLYGYPRKTTPLLEQEDLLVYTDVLTAGPATWISIPHIGTFSTLDGAAQQTTMHDIFRAAGFKTYWLSGDKNITNNDMMYLIGKRADVVFQAAAVNPDDRDELLMQKAEEILADPAPKKFIVIQTWGVHAPYSERYPAGFAEFTDAPPHAFPKADTRTINQYDTAVRYMDTLLAHLVDFTKTRDDVLIMYTTDHGEEVGDYSTGFGHSGSSPFLSCYEVPLFLAMSPAYRQSLGHLVFETGRSFQNDRLLPGLLDLAHIKTSLYKAEDSLFSPAFKPRPRYAQGKILEPGLAP